MKASNPIKIRANVKLPSRAKKPMTIGTTIDANPPIKLNTPPVNPIRCLGARVETKTQVIDAKPFPKKAMVIKKIISGVLFT